MRLVELVWMLDEFIRGVRVWLKCVIMDCRLNVCCRLLIDLLMVYLLNFILFINIINVFNLLNHQFYLLTSILQLNPILILFLLALLLFLLLRILDNLLLDILGYDYLVVLPNSPLIDLNRCLIAIPRMLQLNQSITCRPD